MNDLVQRFAGLPTAAKLLLILTAALLPVGLALAIFANQGLREADRVLVERGEEQSRLAVRAIESLIARNALALRIATNNRPSSGEETCAAVARSLAITPGVAQRFELETTDGEPICELGDIPDRAERPLVAPGDIALKIAPDENELLVRAGVVGGIATGSLTQRELEAAVDDASESVTNILLRDGTQELQIVTTSQAPRGDQRVLVNSWPLGGGRMNIQVTTRVPTVTQGERLLLWLPVLMWAVAAIISWLVVTRALIRPLRRLQRAVADFEPGDPDFVLPVKLGPATEIQELRDSFSRAVERVEQSEHEMGAALEGQRRLVREVHHRVKNNLQVVASLLNIHGRSAASPAARAAYAAIGRRVGALSIVHRNHFAEMEEQRGISLRPLLTELTAELRAGAPEEARALRIDLELDSAHTTQDVAVPIAFLVTEIVEFAMLRKPEDPVEITLRRTSELSARLTINSTVLVPGEESDSEKVQFERIVSGLAKQLRSDVDRKLGRYEVNLAVFPEA